MSQRGYKRRRERSVYNREKREENRHPSHLKGKEIGMFYANRHRHKYNMTAKKRALATIILPHAKKIQIEEMLMADGLGYLLNETDTDSYSHVKDSAFKTNFLSRIKGNIFDKISDASSGITGKTVEDERYLREFNLKKYNPKYIAMMNRRKKLPSYEKKDDLIKVIEENQVVVISGETGCGKTTQVSQFILDYYIENGKGSLCKVVCTQPRRISAISVAERVAEERAEDIGGSVGYQIRLERKPPRRHGSICFCTTGVVLKQMESDPSLSNISHLILDEIHERDVSSDFLITILRAVIKKRKDLKVILMSATINSEAFSKYYDNCPHISIPGFTFPVTQYFLEDILQRVDFCFAENPSPGRGASYGAWHRYKKQIKSNDFVNYIEPYARQLEREGKYDKDVCKQLKNVNSEELCHDLIFELLLDICSKEKEDGAVLIFVPGMANISSLHKLITRSEKFPSNKYVIYPLHSQMATVEQKQIFYPPPTGMRKIIISTNIAETSITIDDVVFVIDCGKIKISNFDVENNTQTLKSEWVSLANANQRKGRAGRVKPGVCFHFFSKARYMILKPFQDPEVQRVRLDDVILTAKLLQLGDAEPFFQSLMDPPKPQAVQQALNLLKRLNALDDNENLTPLGYHLAKLPICPQMGKMILFGAIFSCLDPILSIAASLDYKDPFQIPLGKEQLADRKKVELADGVLSDHLLLHKVLVQFESHRNPNNFCWEYFLSSYTLKLIGKMKKEFMGYLLEHDFVSDLNPKNPTHNKNSNNSVLIKAVICAGLYPNVAIMRPSKRGFFGKIRSSDNLKAYKFHPKSVVGSSKRLIDSPILVFWEKINESLHDASVVHPLPIVFFGDQFEHSVEAGEGFITIGKSLTFKAATSTSRVVQELRDRLNWLLEYKITHPGIVDWDEDSDEIKILRAIMQLITGEEMGEMDEVSDEEDEDDDRY